MKEPRGAPDLSLSLETGGEPESHPPRAPTSILEPLLNNRRCARTSSIDGDGSASNVSCPHADPLHVQFDTQSPSAPLAISSASTSSSNDKERSTATARLPDGGYGWVIVLAAFMLYLIADGITFTFRLFFLYFLNYFGGSIKKAIWTGELLTVMPLLSGPIASFLIDRYGCRRMTIFGSFLAALGFIISAFVDNVETLMFTFGIMAGFGLSLCYVAAVVIIAYYFEKKRSLATGISLCGSGIGTFIFASLTKYYDWLEKYEWRGTNLILAGLLLNMVVCGLLFRDLPWMIMMNGERAKERKHRRERKRNKLFGSSTDSFSHSKSAAGFNKATDAVDIEGVMTSTVPQHRTLVDLPTYMTGGERVSLETFESTQSPVYTTLAQNYPGTSKTLVSPVTTFRRKLSSNDSVSSAPKTSGTKQLTALSLLTSFQKQMQWYAALCWDLIVDILGFSLFLNPAFLVFAVSNFLLHMWHNVPEVYIRDIGFSESLDMSQLAKLIPIISILNMFGQIFFGWIGDLDCLNPILVYAVCMTLCGLVIVVMPLLTSYLGLVIASGAFSAFLATNYCLTSNILVKQMTLKKLTNAYGLLLFIQGLANLIGPPLAGWVFDITNSYEVLFYLAGVFIAISGLVLVVSPLYNHRKRKSADLSAILSTNITTNISANMSSNKSPSNDETLMSNIMKS